MSPISISIVTGLLILFFASALIQQKTLDKWTHDTGRAPMIHKNRRSWAAYMGVAKHEMPASVRKRITFWGRITYLSLILIVVVATIDAGWHRH
jgi:hypothetical protein